MAVQWYPGHMKKASDEIRDALKKVDVVIEIIDARIPVSSSNPMLKELKGAKPCVKVLNKKDLADPAVTTRWIQAMEKEENTRAIAIEALKKKDVDKVKALAASLAPSDLKRGVRALVVGIPNVGKSTFINTLAGRKVAKTGDEPAVTRHQQHVRIDGGRQGFDIADTPGVLWPNLADHRGGVRLGATGAVRDTALDYLEVAPQAVVDLLTHYRELLVGRYKLKVVPEEGLELLAEIGKKRGCLRKGGVVDMHKAAEIVCKEIKAGDLGRISLDWPEDYPNKENTADD
ncbi:ribosome biogenesis GTPase YlqF [Desulfoluna spongiiphila]|uniref:Ribosome biogenesis GTPase A n=1 Tax=Desulfoluna spongiiphila TaxID=419481 RepID=A0A1G5IA54_9BACT|nr:ribosome biogenesis GTPase YlqF [Desulfoluna spongiiphila]SCY72884.1 Ras superfamily GTP-binding protein YlqF [Desulfoluna spongiiphila]